MAPVRAAAETIPSGGEGIRRILGNIGVELGCGRRPAPHSRRGAGDLNQRRSVEVQRYSNVRFATFGFNLEGQRTGYIN